ncbi:hypothetical protein C8R44DRAFT_633233 [Mycena epipterygia]|nr:hypothetical protein C8R44DRAFT_633233 [Mycena epipterygia]
MRRKLLTARLKHTSFPPRPLSYRERHGIISRYCQKMRPMTFVEHRCAVCGWLVSRSRLTPMSLFKGDLNILTVKGVTRKERFDTSDPIEELDGPILADGCTHICVDCESSLNNYVVPKLALARHNWIGRIPDQLKDLKYAEQIMIARVRHN